MSLVATALGAKHETLPRRGWAALAIVALTACTRPPPIDFGGECELNTDCSAPLVCRLGSCRVECRAQRDCPTGLECVRDELGLGACQLPKETECMLSSECPSPLVCRFGHCTNECVSNRDCPPGDACQMDENGERGCRPESTIECTLNSDCMTMGLVCAPDRHCHPPCRTDWDCPDGRRCITDMSPSVCAPPERSDGGVDGGASDGGVPFDAGFDASTVGTDGGTPPMPPLSAPHLAAGLENTCAAPSGHSPSCWGDNAHGQIGDGTTTPRPSPRVVSALGAVTILDVGQDFVCATPGSGLFCWGDNTYGQLGIGTTEDVHEPTELASLPPGVVVDIALGREHACAIVERSLYCWGRNDLGQLGLGDTMDRSTPTRVTLPGSRTPIQLGGFGATTCVAFADHTLACFGDNGVGQVGDPSAPSTVTAPRMVPGLNDVVQVAAGTTHTCAIRSGGAVWCWGSDVLGETGDGGDLGDSPDASPTPTTAIAEPVIQLSAGSTHTCARTASNVYCWGDNNFGISGQPGSTIAVLDPTVVPDLGAVEEVALGVNHTCVRAISTPPSTDYYCWGSNNVGQIGDGSTTDSPSPVLVSL